MFRTEHQHGQWTCLDNNGRVNMLVFYTKNTSSSVDIVKNKNNWILGWRKTGTHICPHRSIHHPPLSSATRDTSIVLQPCPLFPSCPTTLTAGWV